MGKKYTIELWLCQSNLLTKNLLFEYSFCQRRILVESSKSPCRKRPEGAVLLGTALLGPP